MLSGVDGAAVGSSPLSTQTAIAANAARPATAIHQCVRPVCRRLKNSRAQAPIAISATRTNQAWSAPYANGKCPASIVSRTGNVR